MPVTPLVALVTGAASGIGAATVRRLAAEGVRRLVLVDRDAPGLDRLGAEIGGGKLLLRPQDVADEAAWDATEAAIRDRFGRLDRVVVNAGVAAGGAIADTSLAAWRHVLSANLDGAFLTLRTGLRLMRQGGRGGAAVVVASAAAVKAEPGTAAYAASKAGALQLARVAAREGAPDRIRVNALLPGGVETPIWRAVPFFTDLVAKTGSEQAAFAEMAGLATPLGRYATADEIARHIAWLLSDAAGPMTGSAVGVDGGYTL